MRVELDGDMSEGMLTCDLADCRLEIGKGLRGHLAATVVDDMERSDMLLPIERPDM